MLSRALSLATVMLWIGCCVAGEARAQNLEAGKSPSQIFSGTCSACHKSARGLLKTVPAGSLPGFLREHYTTSRDMAAVMAGYLVSNGATDTRYGGGGLTRQGQESKAGGPKPAPDQAETPPGRRPRPGQPQEAARPDADGLGVPGESRSRRRARQNQEGAPGVEGAPAAAAEENPAGRAKHKLGKRNRPGREEPAKPEPAKDIAKDAGKEQGKDEPRKDATPQGEPDKDAKPQSGESAPSDSAKPAPSKPDSVKPADDGKPDATKLDATKPDATKPDAAKPADAGKPETPLRPDPVPQVTPAPKPSESAPKPPDAEPKPAPPASSPAPSDTPAAAPSTPSAEPASPSTARPEPVNPSPPPAPPAAPAGPPAPPISQ